MSDAEREELLRKADLISKLRNTRRDPEPEPQQDERVNADTLGGLTVDEILRKARMYGGGGVSDVALALFDYKGLYFESIFDSLDAYEKIVGAGSISINADGSIIIGTSGLYDESVLSRVFRQDMAIRTPSFSKVQMFEATVMFENLSGHTVYLNVGIEGGSASATLSHHGFKIINRVIYGSVADDLEEANTAALMTALYNSVHILKSVLTPNKRVDFYIDDVYKASLTTRLPLTTTILETVFGFSLYNNTTGAKQYRLHHWKFLQQP